MPIQADLALQSTRLKMALRHWYRKSPVSRETEGAVAHPNGRIYAVASAAGVVIAFDDGNAVATSAGHPGAHDIAVDSDGNLWLADTRNPSYREVQP